MEITLKLDDFETRLLIGLLAMCAKQSLDKVTVDSLDKIEKNHLAGRPTGAKTPPFKMNLKFEVTEMEACMIIGVMHTLADSKSSDKKCTETCDDLAHKLASQAFDQGWNPCKNGVR